MGAHHLTFHLLHRVTFCQPEKFSRHCIGGWGCADLSPFFVHFGGGRGSTINIGSQSGRRLLEKALHGLRCSPCERIWTCFMGCLLCPSVQSLTPPFAPIWDIVSQRAPFRTLGPMSFNSLTALYCISFRSAVNQSGCIREGWVVRNAPFHSVSKASDLWAFDFLSTQSFQLYRDYRNLPVPHRSIEAIMHGRPRSWPRSLNIYARRGRLSSEKAWCSFEGAM